MKTPKKGIDLGKNKNTPGGGIAFRIV